MQAKIISKTSSEQGGFTLVELLVVVLVLAILIGIAVPAFLGQAGSNNGEFAAPSLGTSGGVASALSAALPGITFVASGASSPTTSTVVTNTDLGAINVGRVNESEVILGTPSESGKTCTMTFRSNGASTTSSCAPLTSGPRTGPSR